MEGGYHLFSVSFDKDMERNFIVLIPTESISNDEFLKLSLLSGKRISEKEFGESLLDSLVKKKKTIIHGGFGVNTFLFESNIQLNSINCIFIQ